MPLGSTVVLCAECGVPPIAPENPAPDDEVRCPNCRKSDNVEKVRQDARHFATHQAKRDLEQKMRAEGTAPRMRTPTRIPYKNLRWITGPSLAIETPPEAL